MGVTGKMQDTPITPADLDSDLTARLDDEQSRHIDERLMSAGRVLFRGFPLESTADFAKAVQALGGDPLPYTERSSPRKQLESGIYTSTEYTREEEIFFHNENSYQATWPDRLFFFCQRPPASGGATPLADVRQVTASLDAGIVEEFRRRGWRHVRNYHPQIGLPWREVFGTTSREAVDLYCGKNGIRTHWNSDGTLRTVADRVALHRHPVSGDELWFNHIAFFHWSTLPERVIGVLEQLFGRSGLPNNTVYGDGAEIPAEVCAHIREKYREAATRFDYQQGDLLMIDNMLTAHGREPYEGERQIAVAMT